MKHTKHIALLLVAAFACLSLTGCMGNMYENVATVNGDDISAGLYLMAEFNSYSDASTKVEDEEKDILKQQIDGVKADKWIEAEAERKIRKFVAVKNLARELGMTLSSTGQQNIQQTMQYWEMLEPMYTENGISQNTVVRYMSNEELSREIFYKLYGKDGERAHADDEMKAAYEADNGHIRYISVPIGSQEEGPDMEAEVEAEVDKMVQRLADGEDMDSVAATGLQDVYYLIGREFTEATASTAISTSYIAYQQEEDSYYSQEFADELKGQAIGDVGKYNMGSTFLVYEKVPVFEDDEAFDTMRDTVISALYQEEYDEYLTSIYEAYEVKWAAGAKWYYRPSKIEY